jgi:amino acid permease
METDRLLPRRLIETNSDGGFSFGVALAFSVNFAMGAGFLSLPWAFNQAGIMLSLVIMIIVVLPMIIAIVFNLEAMARAGAYFKYSHSHNDDGSVAAETGLKTVPPELLKGELVVDSERFEVSDLLSLFVGQASERVFIILISLYTYGTLWSYCAVFSKAMATTFPLGDGVDSVTAYLFFFACIVIPLTCLEVTEQVYVQVFLAFCRLAVCILMVGTALIALFRHDDSGDHVEQLTHTLVNFKGLHIILPCATFAYIFTHNVPVIAEPVRDKTALRGVFASTVVICFIGYTSIGLSVSALFGDKVQSSCNLNWSSYGEGITGTLTRAIAGAIATYIVMFPALDVTSAFPLNAISLGNNIMSAVAGESSHTLSRVYKIAFRLAAAIPPFFLAAYVSDVGTITSYTGISGFFLAFIFPPIVAHYSEKLFVAKGWNPTTVYSMGALSSAYARVGVFLFGLVMISYTLYVNATMSNEA